MTFCTNEEGKTVLEHHAKLMTLLKTAGEIIGRKKLQKIVYIAKKLQFPFQEKYEFHFYGPYSEELTLRVEELCNLGFLNETKETKGGYYQYRYRLTEDGERFLQLYELDMLNLDACIANMNGKSSRFLELVSTILHFENLARDEVREKVLTIKQKQNYSENEIDEAYTYFHELEQILKH
jgi:uncharacterized protein YwgA